MKKVWILGGGIAGIEAAISLRQEGFAVTVVSNRDFLFIHPISIWIPTGEKNFDDVCLPLAELAAAHGFDYIVDDIVGIEASHSCFTLKNAGRINYEYLIVAVGGERLQYDGIENTYSICGRPDDSLKIKDKIEELIKLGGGKIAAGFAGNPIDATAVRGEPAFEFIFNIHNMLKKRKIRDKFELIFFTPASASEHRLGSKVAKELQRFFAKLKIVTKFGKKISSFDKNTVLLEDGNTISADMIMFISGRRGPSFLKNSDLPLSEAGFIKINSYCQVDGFENIFAVGDVASIDGPDWRIKQGYLAEIMARNAAFNIFSMENGSDARRSYIEQMNLIFMLDMGDSASFVYRSQSVNLLLPMPIVGHWLKKGWGRYYRLSRLGKIPRLPGA